MALPFKVLWPLCLTAFAGDADSKFPQPTGRSPMSTFDTPAGVKPDEASSPEEIARFVVETAINAPSVNNTQPWWFYGIDREVGMHADDERRLPVADPDGREMMISCGAALFTARVALRDLGIVPQVRVLPEQALPTLIAKINWTEAVPPLDY